MNTYIKIILPVIIGVSLSIAFSAILEKGQISYNSHKYERVNEMFLKNDYHDVLFVGSSRTHTTIDPLVIDSITGLNTYNAGMEGANILEFKLTLDAYLQAHPSPRLLVLTLDAGSFNTGKKMFFPPQYFWTIKNAAIRDNFKNDKKFRIAFIKYLPFLRQVYYDDYSKGLALKGFMGQKEMPDINFKGMRGFATNGYSCIDTAQRHPLTEIPVNESGVATLQSIIDTCKNKNISIFFTYAPEYNFRLQTTMKNFSEFVQAANQIARVNKIPFFRDDSLGLCKNECLFSNFGHVNKYGAVEYSKILGNRIAGYLTKE